MNKFSERGHVGTLRGFGVRGGEGKRTQWFSSSAVVLSGTFQCLFTVCTFSTHCRSALFDQHLTAKPTVSHRGVLGVEFKFLRCDCKVSLPLLPCPHSPHLHSSKSYSPLICWQVYTEITFLCSAFWTDMTFMPLNIFVKCNLGWGFHKKGFESVVEEK